jgi:opacity protein-like surface antigen
MNFTAKVCKSLLHLGAVGVAVSVGAMDASADGRAPRAAAPVVQQAPTSWSGFYFGAHSGWQWSEFNAGFTSVNTGFDVSHDSPVVGGQIGIQHQFGNFVLGVEGTLTVAYQDDYSSSNCPNTLFTCAARFDDVLTIGPRLGWAMGKWMPYITGGYANAAFSEKISRNTASANPWEDRQRHSGWFIGGGVDMAVSAGWVIGLEYRHYEFDDAVYSPTRTLAGNNQVGVIDLCPAPCVNTADAGSDVITLRASWKFDRPRPAPAPIK